MRSLPMSYRFTSGRVLADVLEDAERQLLSLLLGDGHHRDVRRIHRPANGIPVRRPTRRTGRGPRGTVRPSRSTRRTPSWPSPFGPRTPQRWNLRCPPNLCSRGMISYIRYSRPVFSGSSSAGSPCREPGPKTQFSSMYCLTPGPSVGKFRSRGGTRRVVTYPARPMARGSSPSFSGCGTPCGAAAFRRFVPASFAADADSIVHSSRRRSSGVRP